MGRSKMTMYNWLSGRIKNQDTLDLLDIRVTDYINDLH